MKIYPFRSIHLFLILLLLSTLFIGCQSKSYYSANSKNLQRFGGYQLVTANHLVEINDLELLIIELSALAIEEASRRDTYLAATEVQNSFEKMKLETKMESALQRTTLSSTLSAESDKYYHRLKNTSKENFDDRYKNMLIEKLNELKMTIEDYEENGQSDRVKELGEKIDNVIEDHLNQFQGDGVS